MKVTGMFPTIVCKNSEELIKFASEKFGFKVAHTNQAIISDNQSDMGEPVFVNNAKKVLIKKLENIPILLIQHLK